GGFRKPPLLGKKFGPRDAFRKTESGRPRFLNRGVWSVFDADMQTAERYLGKTFYTSLSCDFRGRIVADPHFNYMRQDYVRGLFLFAEGKPIGKRGLYWLKVSTANAFNEKREMTLKPFDERVAWTERYMDRIRDIAANPWCGLDRYIDKREQPRWKHAWLNEAADPIQFVAHCSELVAAFAAGEDFKTRLPLPFDATNSGAQHYSLLARDRDGARLTNLVYEGSVADLYTDVMRRIEKSFARDLDEVEKNVRAEVESARERGDNDLAKVESDVRSRLTKNHHFARFWLSKEVLKRKFIKLLCVEALYGAKEGGLEKE